MVDLQIGPSRADYIAGQQDGRKYFNEQHAELEQRYQSGSPAYRLGFDSERAIKPDDFAS